MHYCLNNWLSDCFFWRCNFVMSKLLWYYNNENGFGLWFCYSHFFSLPLRLWDFCILSLWFMTSHNSPKINVLQHSFWKVYANFFIIFLPLLFFITVWVQAFFMFRSLVKMSPFLFMSSFVISSSTHSSIISCYFSFIFHIRTSSWICQTDAL